MASTKKLSSKKISRKKTPAKKVVRKAVLKKKPAAKTVKPKKTGVKKTAAVKKSVKKNATTKKSKAVKSKAAFPQIGNAAPSFSLLNQEGKKISLSDFAGKENVVLYFYPRAMTPGCTVQACGIRDSVAEFKALDTVVLGVSPDAVKPLVKFRERDKLNFDLLSDPDHIIAEKYGAWGLKKFMGREFMGVLRSTFIIGKDGKLKFIMDQVNTTTHHDDVLAIIKSLS